MNRHSCSRILVVDDEQYIRNLIKEILENDSHSIYLAGLFSLGFPLTMDYFHILS